MSRFCPNCGTEVDDNAAFCPTCGQPIDQAAEMEMPAAPEWPQPSQPAQPSQPGPAEPPPAEPTLAEPPAPIDRQPSWAASAPPPLAWDDEAPPPPPPRPREDVTRVEAHPAAVPPPPARSGPAGPSVDLPLTMPVTLSAWLIGVGAVVAALGIVIGLFDGNINPVELILLLALIGVAATVFFSASLPDVPNLRLATLAVALVGFGIALDRLGFGGAGVGDLLLVLGTAMAAIGAIILELGRDQPLGASG